MQTLRPQSPSPGAAWLLLPCLLPEIPQRRARMIADVFVRTHPQSDAVVCEAEVPVVPDAHGISGVRQVGRQTWDLKLQGL